jgi:hypothetical protein
MDLQRIPRALRASEVMMTEQDAVLFHRLYQPLLVYAAQRTGVASGVRTPEDLRSLGKDKLIEIRDQCHARQDLIEQFCQANPSGFTSEDLESVRMWKHHAKGTFFVVKVTKEGALFLDERKDGKAYLVQPLLSTFEELLPARPPVRVDAVLLPFKGRVVYDGLLGRREGRLMCRNSRGDSTNWSPVRTRLGSPAPPCLG